MDWFFRLFDLFLAGARKLGSYFPQSGEDVIQMFNVVLGFTLTINNWIANTVGIDIRRILMAIGRLVVIGFNWFVDIIKALVERI
jgi:hypothetical protein